MITQCFRRRHVRHSEYKGTLRRFVMTSPLEAEPSGICKSRQRPVEVAIVMVHERGGDKLSQ